MERWDGVEITRGTSVGQPSALLNVNVWSRQFGSALFTTAGKTTGPTLKSSPRKDAMVRAGCTGNNVDGIACADSALDRTVVELLKVVCAEMTACFYLVLAHLLLFFSYSPWD